MAKKKYFNIQYKQNNFVDEIENIHILELEAHIIANSIIDKNANISI